MSPRRRQRGAQRALHGHKVSCSLILESSGGELGEAFFSVHLPVVMVPGPLAGIHLLVFLIDSRLSIPDYFRFGVPVCPHGGGVGLCEYVIHLR